MRIVLSLLVLLTSMQAVAQRAFYGRITDKEGQPIPFAVVQVKDRNEGAYTNENGQFALIVNTDSAQALIFYCMGYEKREMQLAGIPRDSVHIQLGRTSNTLRTVTIKEKAGKSKKRVLGRKRMKHLSDCYEKYGDEDVVFLKTDGKRRGTLKEIRVFITAEGAPDSKFRIHVYEKDPATNMPGTEITDSNLILHGTKGNEWVRADVSSRHIPVGDGVFISVEWISGHGNTDLAMQSQKHTEVSAHNGQVLGLALNYGVPYMYHREAFHKEWLPIQADHLCPMIYGVFTYIK